MVRGEINNGFLHEDRLFSPLPIEREIARELYKSVKDAPIVSPHGHTDAKWFAQNNNFENATELLLVPDHYVYRMLYSQGIELTELGVTPRAGRKDFDPRKAWQIFATNFHLLRGTASHVWLNQVFGEVFGFENQLSPKNADFYYDTINDKLKSDDFKPRNLFDKFKIEVLATTESPLDELKYHKQIVDSDWNGRVISAYRPDNVVDPEFETFAYDLNAFGEIAGENIDTFAGYLKAHRNRREFFKSMGVTSTDHGHKTSRTEDFSTADCEALYQKIISGKFSKIDAENFRAQMLTEFAKMSIDDGLVMQIHAGAYRNHNLKIFEEFGRDKGGDVPSQTNYTDDLKPLLDKYGNEKSLSIILFTLDETTYSRELAPLAGHYPCLNIGPAWWFNDCPEGMLRFRELITPVAGFYNTIGFNDDTRAFLSIPARHDMARRIDARFLASLVASHRLSIEEASDLIIDLTSAIPKKAYKL